MSTWTKGEVDHGQIRGLFFDLLGAVPQESRGRVRELIVLIAEMINLDLLSEHDGPPLPPRKTLSWENAAIASLRHAADTLYAMTKTVEQDGLSDALRAKMNERASEE